MTLLLLASLAHAGDLKLTLTSPGAGPVTLELKDVASCQVSTAHFVTETGVVWDLRATPSSPEQGQTLVSMEVTYELEGDVQTSRPAILVRDGEPGEITLGLPDRSIYSVSVLTSGFEACPEPKPR